MESKNEAQKPAIETSLTYHTVCVGSGPIGLLAALSALQHGKKVAILADRKEELGIRQQVLWIQDDVFQFVKKLVGDQLIEQYMSELAITEDEKEGYYLTTGDFEKLLYAALSDYTLGKDYDFINVQKISPQQAVTQAIQIDKENQTITVRTLAINNTPFAEAKPCTLNFKNLIAADGAKRTIAKAMGETEVLFDDTQSPIHHTKHVVATFRIPEGTTPQVCSKLKVYPGSTGPEVISMPVVHPRFTRNISPCSLETLKNTFGWKGYTRPYSQIYATRDVVYIGAEIPADLPKEKAREYAITIMQDQLPKDYIEKMTEIYCDMSTTYGKKMDQLKISVFNIELGELNKTLQVCANQDESKLGIIFYMGDAKKNPLYTTGTGVQTGIREVMGFDTYLNELAEPKDKKAEKEQLREAVENYHSHTQDILATIREVQNNWVTGRTKKEKEAEKNYNLLALYEKNITEFNAFMKKLNETHAKIPSTETTETHEFFRLLHTDLNNLKEKYKKICAFYHEEANITSYTGMNVEDMIDDFQKIKRNLMAKYPTIEQLLDDAPNPIAECYTKFKEQFKIIPPTSTVAPSKIGIFSSNVPHVTNTPELNSHPLSPLKK